MAVKLLNVYFRLYERYGEQFWWPGDSEFEIICGAVLTQNTSWSNVEKAVKNLKTRGLLEPVRIVRLPDETLEKLIFSSGFYRQKARRLKVLSRHLAKRVKKGDWGKFFSSPMDDLREELLSINGLGPETVDSILLYAGELPSFVIDAYTRRMVKRLGISGAEDYEELKSFFEKNLPCRTPLYNEFHALIVTLGKDCCRVVPRCGFCPLRKGCPYPGEN